MVDVENGAREQVLEFGPFQLIRSRKVLFEDGRRVRLGSRAFGILLALVERAGEVVGKNELTAIAWPNTFVEESNLRVHVAAIRRILGDGQGQNRYIINVSGRGYSFVAPVARNDVPRPPVVQSEQTAVFGLPVPLTRAIGRDEVIRTLMGQLSQRRLVTIAGPGGVGKSTVALGIAEQFTQANPQSVYFVDLAGVESPSLVPAALATAVGISALVDDPIPSLIANLRDTRELIVLDNCEHLITAAASLAERILHAVPGATILATSREPLLAEGEHVHHLVPLQCPPAADALTSAQALEYSAVTLFVERATNSMDSFDLSEDNASVVAGICRRLDGVPLAIELVAARVGAFGVEALASGLDDNLLLASKGRRTASVRHQSLRSTLAWSYRLLTPIDQAILRRLVVFRGPFTAGSAAAIASGGTVTAAEVLDEGLMSLAAKSLLTVDVSGPAIRYRLLHITRAYGAEQLLESGERDETLRRHAEHHRALLEEAVADWENLTRSQWLARYDYAIDDVRAALDWAFQPGGDISIGTALTVASLPFGFQMVLIDEFKRRVTLALNSLANLKPPQPLSEMRLITSMNILFHQTDTPPQAIRASIARAITLAEQLGFSRYTIDAYAGRALCGVELGDYDSAVRAADNLAALAKTAEDPIGVLIADRVRAQVFHYAGDHRRARQLAERVLRHPIRAIPLAYGQMPVDRRVSMRIVLSRILWLEGRAEQAREVAAEAVEFAASDGPSAICQALGMAACPIAFWTGDLHGARSFTRQLLEYSRRYTLNRWTRMGLCYQMTAVRVFAEDWVIRDHETTSADVMPNSSLERDLLGTICDYWIDPMTTIRAAQHLAGWCTAEVLRATAAIALREQGSRAASSVESTLRTSLLVAREQGALAWELRTVTGLAQLWRGQNRPQEALDALNATYTRFTEGHGTVDLKTAQSLLEELRADS